MLKKIFGRVKAEKKAQKLITGNAIDYLFNVTLIGPPNSGKSSLMKKFCDNSFSEEYIRTIGIDFRTKMLQHGASNVKLVLYDTSGSEEYREIQATYIRGARAVVLVFNLAKRTTFAEVEEILKRANPSLTIVGLVGIGSDLASQREVSYMEARDFADLYDIDIYKEISCKTGEGVEELFQKLTELIILRN